MPAQRTLAKVIVVTVLVAIPLTAVADPGGNDNGNGNAYGWGFGNGDSGGRGGPLPALGATLLGQFGLAMGGAWLLWRRRASRKPEGRSDG